MLKYQLRNPIQNLKRQFSEICEIVTKECKNLLLDYLATAVWILELWFLWHHSWVSCESVTRLLTTLVVILHHF